MHQLQEVECVPTKTEELSDRLISVPVPGNLTSYLLLNAEPEIN